MASASIINPMISCKKASELLDKKSVLKLSVREKIALKLHLIICEACKRYKKQTRFLDKMLQSHSQIADPDQVPQHTNERLKDKIFTRLKEN